MNSISRPSEANFVTDLTTGGTSLNTTGDIMHTIDDPGVENLVEKIPYSEVKTRVDNVTPTYKVEGFSGGGFDLLSAQGRCANAYVTMLETLELVKKVAYKPMEQWAAVPVLPVFPFSGEDLNAFYDRSAIRLFYYKDFFTVDSAVILSHECGHAILDSYRPETWSVQNFELWSFHESFGDMIAILMVLQNDAAVNKAINETGGNMRNPNFVTKLAEQMGQVIYKLTGGRMGGDSLRNADNDFKYSNPANLPQKANDDKTITAEAHSFSRIFTGTFYDILVMMHETYKAEGMNAVDALKAAQTTLGKYLFKAICFAPIHTTFFESIAKTILWVDWSDQKKFHDKMWDIFVNRNIVTQVKSMYFNPEFIPDGTRVQFDNGVVITIDDIQTIKLSDHKDAMMLNDDNPLYNYFIDVAKQHAYFLDLDNNPLDSIVSLEEKAVAMAKFCLDKLYKADAVGEGKLFSIVDNKIVRNRYIW